MLSRKPLLTIKPLKAHLFTLTVALLLTSCAVKIADFEACSPIPGDLGAVCDNFLTNNPKTLDQSEWILKQAQWMGEGFAVECITSDAIGNIKGEIEKLCSKARCDYQTKQSIIKGLQKIQALRAHP